MVFAELVYAHSRFLHKMLDDIEISGKKAQLIVLHMNIMHKMVTIFLGIIENMYLKAL